MYSPYDEAGVVAGEEGVVVAAVVDAMPLSCFVLWRFWGLQFLMVAAARLSFLQLCVAEAKERRRQKHRLCVIEIDVFPLVQVCFSATSSMRALYSTRTLDELYENLK